MYVIDSLAVEYAHYYDQIIYTIWYYDDIGEHISLNIAIDGYEMSTAYSPEEFFIEAIGKHDSKLMGPMRDYLAKNLGFHGTEQWKTIGQTSDGSSFKYKASTTSEHNKHVHVNLSVYGNGTAYFPGEVSAGGGPDAGIASLPGLKEMVKHPKVDDTFECKHIESTVKHMIMHLNDFHRWPREHIADWLETLDVDLRFKSQDDKLMVARQKKIDSMKKSMDTLTANIESWNKLTNSATEEFNKVHKAMTKLQEELNEQN